MLVRPARFVLTMLSPVAARSIQVRSECRYEVCILVQVALRLSIGPSHAAAKPRVRGGTENNRRARFKELDIEHNLVRARRPIKVCLPELVARALLEPREGRGALWTQPQALTTRNGMRSQP
jgi:hypothetical protein